VRGAVAKSATAARAIMAVRMEPRIPPTVRTYHG
jgi:hypothetical protein